MSHSIVLDFRDVQPSDERSVGGKAYQLARMLQGGLPVPPGCVLRHEPRTEDDWREVLAWWSKQGNAPLAVRSSAIGEDGAKLSFAGQQQSFLDVADASRLRETIRGCFASILRDASLAYREFFGDASAPGERHAPRMNVVLQRMVAPAFAGVFFSRDPRAAESEGYVLEAIEGLGENLVSGQLTPMLVREGRGVVGVALPGWREGHEWKVAEAGRRAQALLGFEVDMEWAIDRGDRLWVLQARPITTSHRAHAFENEVTRELRRLELARATETIWDGQTFAEWPGVPTPLSLGTWQRAFRRDGAFGRSLSQLGYLGSHADPSLLGRASVLEPVFGRAYVNLTRMEALLLGDTAYVTVPDPKPHLEFRWNRVSLDRALHAPLDAARMLKVAWTMQSHRRALLARCREALDAEERTRPDPPEGPGAFARESRVFAQETALWPFALVLMIESTLQGVRSMLSKRIGATETETALQKWMATGVHTLTAEMDREHARACEEPARRREFLERFGHRAAGELELARPRWRELGDAAFASGGAARTRSVPQATAAGAAVLLRDPRIGSLHAQMIGDELKLLGEMLELRERWKSSLMKRYARLRDLVRACAMRTGLLEEVYWLMPRELERLDAGTLHPAVATSLAARRRSRIESFRSISLPEILTLDKLRRALKPSKAGAPVQGAGQGLSPGLAYGEVRVVRDPALARPSEWPAKVILVAEATDPGWTPLFMHATGIVVEKGGVLSHCAIVAREMGIPVVSGIPGCHLRMKEGQHVWVDGSNGRVALA